MKNILLFSCFTCLTVLFLALEASYGVNLLPDIILPDTWYGLLKLLAVIVVVAGICGPLLLIMAYIFPRAFLVILITFDEIGLKYGNKQHLLNLLWLLMFAAFFISAYRLVDLFELISGTMLSSGWVAIYAVCIGAICAVIFADCSKIYQELRNFRELTEEYVDIPEPKAYPSGAKAV